MSNCKYRRFMLMKFSAQEFKQRQGGFAYLWTLMLVAFMGIGFALSSEIYSTTLQREKERQLIAVGREFRNAIASYYESNQQGAQKQYPTTLDELIKDSRFLQTRRHLRRIYIDPVTGHSEWGIVYVKGRIAGVHSLSDRKPLKQDNFEVGEASFRGKEKYSEWMFTFPSNLLLTTETSEAPALETKASNLSTHIGKQR